MSKSFRRQPWWWSAFTITSIKHIIIIVCWWTRCSSLFRESRSWREKTVYSRRRKKRWTRRSFASRRAPEVSFTRHCACVSEKKTHTHTVCWVLYKAEVKENRPEGWAGNVSTHKSGLCAEVGRETSCIEFQTGNAEHLFLFFFFFWYLLLSWGLFWADSQAGMLLDTKG